MDFKQYPSYKDSGVEWLGEVPEHWFRIAIKFLATEKNSLFLDGDWIESKNISDSGIRYITTGNVSIGEYKEQGSGFISEKTFVELGCKEVLENDILISRLNLPIGRSCLVPNLNSRVITSVDNVIFRPNSNYSKKYLVYLFSSANYFYQTESLGRGATMQRISRTLLGNIRISLPDLDEQNQIVSFLDYETSRINNLIAKQEKLIKLLDEHRKSIISHAVTKGLDLNVKMKDSGVEWLGRVPEHWNISKIKFLSRLISNKTASKTNVIALENIESWTGKFISTDSEFDSDAVAFEVDDVLFGKLRPYLAKVYLANKDGQALGDIYVLRPNKLILSKFLYYTLLSVRFIDYVNSSTNGTKMPRANWEFIGAASFCLPTLEEQNQIIKHIDEKWEKIDNLIYKQTKLIEKLKEYRTSIISHAVTGKIDVRDLAV